MKKVLSISVVVIASIILGAVGDQLLSTAFDRAFVVAMVAPDRETSIGIIASEDVGCPDSCSQTRKRKMNDNEWPEFRYDCTPTSATNGWEYHQWITNFTYVQVVIPPVIPLNSIEEGDQAPF
jgi:hypothetical protein